MVITESQRTATRPSLSDVPLHVFAKVVCAFAFLLLVAGGLVTSTGSSLSVPDWPLSFGKVMPPMIGGVAFEHGHRLIAGVVALLTWSLALWLHRARSQARFLGYAAAGGVLLQALLGGATVLLRLPPQISISHACLGQTVFCLLVAIAQATSPWYAAPASRGAGAAWKTGCAALLAGFVQLALGAYLRHTGSGLFAHAGWAAVVVVAVLSASTKGMALRRPEFGLEDPSTLLSLLVIAQVTLGYLSYKTRFAPDFVSGFSRGALITAGHLAVGALILATTLVWTMRAARSR
jgi:cytochrome c oxidase assembly protein subunit 15